MLSQPFPRILLAGAMLPPAVMPAAPAPKPRGGELMGAPAAPLSARCIALYGILRRIAAGRGHTPKIGDLLAVLHGLGHRSSAQPRALHGDIIRLVDAGLIRTHGVARTRVYEVIGVGSTVRRPGKRLSAETLAKLSDLRSRRGEQKEGWPRPTKDSRAQYDAAMRLGPPIRIQGPPAQARTHLAVRSTAPAKSLTGCSAALAAEAV
jgi:hypothetical protein